MSYRLWLAAGETRSHELPLAALQCRRRLGASTWATLEVPTWSAALQALIESWIAGELVVMADEAEFLRAVLTEVESERTAFAGRMTLTGRVQNPTYSATSRTLTGVERRWETDGRHGCRCAVDPLLRPNDPVDDGASIWTAGIIVYRIGAEAAWMEVTEVLDG